MNSIVIPPSPNWYFPDILNCAPDGTLVYGSNVNIVIVNPKPEDQPADIKLISLAHHERISSISLNSKWDVGNKFIASSGEEKAVKVWNAETLELFKSHNSHTTNESRLVGAAYAGSDKVVSVSEDGMIIVWKVSTNELSSLNNLFKGKVQVTSLAICPHAPWLCAFGMKNGFVFITDLRLNGQIKHKLRGHEKSVTDLTWCPVPVNVFPKVKAKQITLKDRLQKYYDEAKSQDKGPPLDRGDSVDIKPIQMTSETNLEISKTKPTDENETPVDKTTVDITENKSDNIETCSITSEDGKASDETKICDNNEILVEELKSSDDETKKMVDKCDNNETPLEEEKSSDVEVVAEAKELIDKNGLTEEENKSTDEAKIMDEKSGKNDEEANVDKENKSFDKTKLTDEKSGEEANMCKKNISTGESQITVEKTEKLSDENKKNKSTDETKTNKESKSTDEAKISADETKANKENKSTGESQITDEKTEKLSDENKKNKSTDETKTNKESKSTDEAKISADETKANKENKSTGESQITDEKTEKLSDENKKNKSTDETKTNKESKSTNEAKISADETKATKENKSTEEAKIASDKNNEEATLVEKCEKLELTDKPSETQFPNNKESNESTTLENTTSETLTDSTTSSSEEESRRVLEKNRVNTLKSSVYKFKKNNPWVNLQYADDDELEFQAEEVREGIAAAECDFLKECLSLRDKISKVVQTNDSEEEEEEAEVKEMKPRAILKARKPRKSENTVHLTNIEDDLFTVVGVSKEDFKSYSKQWETIAGDSNSDEAKLKNVNLISSSSDEVKLKNISMHSSSSDEVKLKNLSVERKLNDEDLSASVAELMEESDKIKTDLERAMRDLEKVTVSESCSKEGVVNKNKEAAEESVELRKEFLLASASNNGSVIIWRAGTDGKVETKFTVSNKGKFRNRSSARDKVYTSTCWISPTILLTSGSCGELLQWDLKNYTQSTPLKSKMIHNDHQSVLFSIAAPVDKTMPVEGGNWREENRGKLAAWTIGQERMLLKTTIDMKRKTVACYQTLGNSVQCLAASPIDPNKLAIGTADSLIKIWDLSRPHLQCITMTAHKVKSKVLCVAYHPEQENVLAFGAEDGQIGLINPNCSSKPATLLVHYFRSSIYKLEWGPIEAKEEQGLYACSEGVLILYNVKNPLDTPTVIQTPDGKYITQFAWKQDYSRLALGTKDGSIFIFSRELEFQTSLFYQQKSIVALYWHPVATMEDEDVSPYESWLASSASDGSIAVYDMKNTSEDTELMTRVIAEQKEHTKFIRGMAWSPHEGGKLLSSSEDGTAHIWDVKNKTIVSSYLNSYCQPITACTWSPLDKNYAILAGRQCTLFIININDYKPMSKADVVKEMNKRKKNLGGNPIKEEKQKKVEEVVVKKSVNPRDLMLTSVTSLQRDKDALLKDCKNLIAVNDGNTSIEKNAVLQLFGNKEDVHKLIDHQKELHASKSRHGLNQNLSLWKGDIGESIRKAMAEGQLSPWLISLAPMVSPTLWQEACESYANQLTEDPNGDALQAASYFLSCHKVEKAVEVLCLRKLYKEALVLAKCRLPSEKDLIDKIIIDWATYYIINGSYEISAQCYIALEKYEEAAKALYKRSDLEILALAVELAEKSNNTDMVNAIKFRYESFKASGGTNEIELQTQAETDEEPQEQNLDLVKNNEESEESCAQVENVSIVENTVGEN